MEELIIRKGKIEDLPSVLELAKELALYEKGLDQVTNTVERMKEDGFGDKPVFGFFVAENQRGIVGVSIYYFRYSTWKGKRLYLEDIVVTEKERGKGIGKELFESTLQQSLDEACTGMMFQVLDWNEPAINFYKKYDVAFDGGWINCGLEAGRIREILKKEG